MPNLYLIAGVLSFGLLAGWHSHTIYDGYNSNKEKDAIIDNRIIGENKSNNDAAKTAHKESEDDIKAKEGDTIIAKHIDANATGFSCVIPSVGVRDLQQAVASHSRTGKSH